MEIQLLALEEFSNVDKSRNVKQKGLSKLLSPNYYQTTVARKYGIDCQLHAVTLLVQRDLLEYQALKLLQIP